MLAKRAKLPEENSAGVPYAMSSPAKSKFRGVAKVSSPRTGIANDKDSMSLFDIPEDPKPHSSFATVEPHVVEIPCSSSDPSSVVRQFEVELAPVLELPQNSPSASHPASLRFSFPLKWTHGFSRAPLVIEVFAGSARLSKACRDAGFRTLAIDHKRGETSFPVLCLDLTVPKDQLRLRDILLHEAGNIALLHFAPPCGTASAARTANQLYSFTGSLAKELADLLVLVSVENPLNSLAWFTDGLDDLCRREPSFVSVFAHCMMGGDRDKYTKWWASQDTFRSLNVNCSRDHVHKSWVPRKLQGRLHFPTAEETSYPELLCKRIASLLVAKHPEALLASADKPKAATRIALDKQLPGHLSQSFAARRPGPCQCETTNC